MWNMEIHLKEGISEVIVGFHQQLLKTGVAGTPNIITTGLVMGEFSDGASLLSENILNQMGGSLVFPVKGNPSNQIKIVLLPTLG